MPRVGRNREKNKRLPTGWTPIGKRMYFVPTNEADIELVKRITGGKKSMPLGDRDDHNGCATEYANRIVKERDAVDEIQPGTIGELVALAFRDILPTIESEVTRVERTRHWNALKIGWGSRHYAKNVHEASMEPRRFFTVLEVQGHLDACATTRHVAANREVDSWSLMFDWARTRWGRTQYNPCAGVFKNPEDSRDALPKHEDLYRGVTTNEDGEEAPRGIYRQLDPPARFILNMYRYYGRRRHETLRLMLSDAQPDGVHMLRAKERQRRGSAKRGSRKPRVLIIPWDDVKLENGTVRPGRLRKMWNRALEWRKTVARERIRAAEKKSKHAPATKPAESIVCANLLVNRKGMPFTKEAAKSAWRRGMLRSGQLGQFVQHDVRALRASTLPEDVAVDVLAHESNSMVRRVYRNRGPKIIDFKGHK